MKLITYLIFVNVMTITSSHWNGILPWYSESSKYLKNIILTLTIFYEKL